MTTSKYDALVLFSGGLDSILAVKLLQDQGLRVLGLHFTSPFFGKPHLLGHWREVYGIEAVPVDVGAAFVEMLRHWPANGYGKHLNPCVDCKILMLRTARSLLARYGARFLATGEVLGQRPMSQRQNALNLIRRDAGVRDLLLRPLSANRLQPTPMERDGIVDRSRLPAIWGRGRRDQLALAAQYGITEIPTPGGGCRLTEIDPAARYLPILTRLSDPRPEDFALANAARQYWTGPYWLSIGRNASNNAALEAAARPGDILIRMRDVTGPLALGRQYVPAAARCGGAAPGAEGSPERWPDAVIADAAAFVASYAPHARAEVTAGREAIALVVRGGDVAEIAVAPARKTPLDWREPLHAELTAWKKLHPGPAHEERVSE